LGLSELTIKALLGHARLGVTSGYIARLDSVLLETAEKVSRYIEEAMVGEGRKVVRLDQIMSSRESYA